MLSHPTQTLCRALAAAIERFVSGESLATLPQRHHGYLKERGSDLSFSIIIQLSTHHMSDKSSQKSSKFRRFFHIRGSNHSQFESDEMAQQYLKGKTAIVTGAGKMNGIGAASAIALAEQGANVRLMIDVHVVPTEN
jgi:3-oxoacyl-ACP reductase-like protein